MVAVAIIETDTKILHRTRKWINNLDNFNCTIDASGMGKFFEQLDLSQPPAILIMDLFGKHGSNLDHLKKIKILLPTSKILLHTARIDEHNLYRALKMGINAIRISQLTSNTLSETLDRLLQGKDYIDPALSNDVMKLFRSEITLEDPASVRLSQFAGLLNQRELQVIKGLTQGKQYKEIATDLFISINTVRHYVKLIYKKFDVNNKMQLLKKLEAVPVPG